MSFFHLRVHGLELLGRHPREHDADSFDEGEKYSADDGTACYRGRSVFERKGKQTPFSFIHSFTVSRLNRESGKSRYTDLLRAARIPPVAAPLMIEFQGSSFLRMCARVQSNVVNIPPHIAKLPPIMGARSLTASREPTRRRLKPCVSSRIQQHDSNLLFSLIVNYTSATTGTHAWCVSKTAEDLKDGPSNCTHCEGAAAVVHDTPRTTNRAKSRVQISSIPDIGMKVLSSPWLSGVLFHS